MDNSQEEVVHPQDERSQSRIKESLLPAAHALTGTLKKQPKGSNVLEDTLRARLMDVKQMDMQFLELTEQLVEEVEADELQYLTGGTALKILQEISIEERRGAVFELSLTDQSALWMLAALVFRWKLSKETEEFNKPTSSSRPRALNRLLQTTLILLRTIFPEEAQPSHGELKNTVGAILIHHHAIEILPSMFCLGWLPPGECEEGPYIRSSTLRLLSR